MAWSIYQSFVNVNSFIWVARLGVGMNGPHYSCVAPCIYMMLGIVVPRMYIVFSGMSTVGSMMEWCCLGRGLLCCGICECVIPCVHVHDLTRLTNCWVVALCFAIIRPLRNV